MKKYLLGAFLVIAMNLFGAKLSDVKGIEKLKNYNEIKDTQVEKIVNYDITKSISKKIFSTEDNKFNGVLVKNENKSIIFGLIAQGILFYLFNFVNEDKRILLFISISMISFINLSIYNTKLQDYAETKFGSKIYSLRQLSKSLFNFVGISILTYFTIQLKIDYQNILVVFCFLTVIANILLIKNNITTYIVESNK